MIGQKTLIETLSSCLPQFTIIVGDKGSGKKTLCQELSRIHGDMIFCFEPDNKVDTVRQAITEAYKNTSPTVYAFTDTDNMSGNAKNALLKVTEEPPNNSYFIVTLESLSNTLETLRSRGTVCYMNPYTENELYEYAISIDPDIYDTKWELVKSICENPGEVKDVVIDFDVIEFYEFVDKVVSYIDKASGSNVFKISMNLKLKDEMEGYDLKLFFRTFILVCKNRYEVEKDIKYLHGIQVTSSYLSELSITGISKQGVMDLWILDVRKEWM